MWKEAIKAVKDSDEDWIKQHQSKFKIYFREQNLDPKGKLSQMALEEHYKTGLFKMFLSKSLGGLELPLQTGSRWIENAATLDSSWGWLLAIGTGGAYFADYMPSNTAEKFFLPKEALVAGSGKPNGKAVDCGSESSEVSGVWSYCSGAEQASLFTAVVNTTEGTSAIILPVEEVKIRRDWNAIGLPLTCSHTLVANKINIPKNYFFDLKISPRKSSYPLATYPFLMSARACFVPVLIGISNSFWKEVEILLEQKEMIWNKYQPQRYQYILEKQVNFSSRILELKKDFYTILKKSWQEHYSGGDSQEKDLSEKTQEVTGFCYASCTAILPALGMDIVHKNHPLQLLWKDFQTAIQHAVFQKYEEEL